MNIQQLRYLVAVLVSPIGSDLPSAVSWDDVVTQPFIMPPAGSGRRRLIDDMATRVVGATPQVSLVSEDRGSWIAAAQAGMGSFLSYRPVVAGFKRIEIRSFEPPHTATVGFLHRVGPVSRAAEQLMGLTRAMHAEASSTPMSLKE